MKLRHPVATALGAYLLILFGLIVSVLVVGCASTDMPDTFNKKLLVAYGTIDSVAKTTEQLLRAGKISKEDARNVVTQAQAAMDGLKVAEQVHQSDPTAGDARLQSVITVLTALQTYLTTRGGGA